MKKVGCFLLDNTIIVWFTSHFNRFPQLRFCIKRFKKQKPSPEGKAFAVIAVIHGASRNEPGETNGVTMIGNLPGS
jgi:hypothetical protein